MNDIDRVIEYINLFDNSNDIISFRGKNIFIKNELFFKLFKNAKYKITRLASTTDVYSISTEYKGFEVEASLGCKDLINMINDQELLVKLMLDGEIVYEP